MPCGGHIKWYWTRIVKKSHMLVGTARTVIWWLLHWPWHGRSQRRSGGDGPPYTDKNMDGIGVHCTICRFLQHRWQQSADRMEASLESYIQSWAWRSTKWDRKLPVNKPGYASGLVCYCIWHRRAHLPRPLVGVSNILTIHPSRASV